MTETVQCPFCHNHYENISQHWAMSSQCDYLEYTLKQQSVLAGTLLHKGTVEESAGKNPVFSLTSTRREVVEFIDDVFGIHSRGVEVEFTAEELQQAHAERGWDVKDPSTVYAVHLRAHPDLRRYRDHWYEKTNSEYQKKIPESLVPTKTILKTWYVIGGHLENPNSQFRVSAPLPKDISQEFVQDFFSEFNPRIYSDRDALSLKLRNTEEFFNVIGEPTGEFERFEEKWPTEDMDLFNDDERGTECPTCGQYFTYIGSHWQSDCDHPQLTDQQEETITALALAGASITRTEPGKNPFLTVDSTQKDTLEELASQLGFMTSSIESRNVEPERIKDWIDESAETFQTVYRLQTHNHPALSNYLNKTDDVDVESLKTKITLTPTVLRTFYLRRGSYINHHTFTGPALRTEKFRVSRTFLESLLDPLSPEFIDRSHSDILAFPDEDEFFEYTNLSTVDESLKKLTQRTPRTP